MKDYITARECAERFSLSTRRIQVLCQEGRITGAKKIGNTWLIPENAEKPSARKKKELSSVKESGFWDLKRIHHLQDYIREKRKPKVARFPRRMYEIDPNALENYIDLMLEKSFSEVLFLFIDAKGLNDVDVYKKAGVDRRVFSKIKSNRNYRPSFETAIRFALALELELKATNVLLQTAGYSLSASRKEDLVMMYCIENHIYSYEEIEEALAKVC